MSDEFNQPRFDYGQLNNQKYIETSKDVINRRNDLILRMFVKIDLPVVTTGNPNHPMLIYKDSVALGTYLRNFELTFKQEFDGRDPSGNILTVRLDQHGDFDKGAIIEAIRLGSHQKEYTILLKGTNLSLSGYNFRRKYANTGRYPVFSKHGIKYFPNKNYAEDITIALMRAGYGVELIDVAELDEVITHFDGFESDRDLPENFTFV